MLINCVAYQNGHKVADIAIDEIHRYLGKPDCLVWVALREPDSDSQVRGACTVEKPGRMSSRR